MDPIVKSLYMYFYGNKGLALKYIKYAILPHGALEILCMTGGSRAFLDKHVKFGSNLYFRLLEMKSKEVREEWGREAVHHSRSLRNVKKLK